MPILKIASLARDKPCPQSPEMVTSKSPWPCVIYLSVLV